MLAPLCLLRSNRSISWSHFFFSIERKFSSTLTLCTLLLFFFTLVKVSRTVNWLSVIAVVDDVFPLVSLCICYYSYEQRAKEMREWNIFIVKWLCFLLLLLSVALFLHNIFSAHTFSTRCVVEHLRVILEAIKRQRRWLRWWWRYTVLRLQIIQYTIYVMGGKVRYIITRAASQRCGLVYTFEVDTRVEHNWAKKTNHRRWSASYFLPAFTAHISGPLQNHLSLEWTNNNISTDVFMLMIWWNEWNFLLTERRRGKTFSQHLTWCYSIAAQQRTPSTSTG